MTANNKNGRNDWRKCLGLPVTSYDPENYFWLPQITKKQLHTWSIWKWCLDCFVIFLCVCLCTVVLLTQAGILSPNKTDYHYGNSIKKKLNPMISSLKTRLSTFYQLFSSGRMKISHCCCQHRLKCTIIFKKSHWVQVKNSMLILKTPWAQFDESN